MNTQHSKRKPDFFIVLVLLVIASFGATVLLQLMTANMGNMAESQSIEQPIKRLHVRS